MITDARACKTKSGDFNACRICREKVKMNSKQECAGSYALYD